ncbi:MAG: saccharopine dehydrogenase NADP-binding domain-containing protein [Pseudomonadota bacterium]
MSDNQMNVTVIGAAGDMTGRFLKGVAASKRDSLRFRLLDIDGAGARRAASLFPDAQVDAGTLDLYDAKALAQAVSGSDLVINGAGPFHRTADIVRRAAIAAGASYLDIDDDVESTLAGFDLDPAARDAGCALFIGCGASPGLTNVLARDLADRLDGVDRVDVAWCVGDEGPQEPGRSVIAHTLHMGAGDYMGWQGGERATRPTFVNTRHFDLPDLARQAFYECAHPEPVMLGRSFEGLRDATCFGTLHPAPINGVLRGVAEAERDGRLTEDEAIDYLQQQIAGKPGDKTAEREALRGMREQVARGEVSRGAYYGFLMRDMLKLRYRTRAATAAIVSGIKDGRPCRLMRFIDSSEADSPLKSMDVSTGLSQAAFFLEALDRIGTVSGCLTPEQWIDPKAFYARLATQLGCPQDEWLSPVKVLEGAPAPVPA